MSCEMPQNPDKQIRSRDSMLGFSRGAGLARLIGMIHYNKALITAFINIQNDISFEFALFDSGKQYKVHSNAFFYGQEKHFVT